MPRMYAAVLVQPSFAIMAIGRHNGAMPRCTQCAHCADGCQFPLPPWAGPVMEWREEMADACPHFDALTESSEQDFSSILNNILFPDVRLGEVDLATLPKDIHLGEGITNQPSKGDVNESSN